MRYFKWFYADTPEDFDISKVQEKNIDSFYELIKINPDIIAKEISAKEYNFLLDKMVKPMYNTLESEG